MEHLQMTYCTIRQRESLSSGFTLAGNIRVADVQASPAS